MTIPEDDLWLLQAVEAIVAKKKDMGFQSSLPFEFLRLAKCGLMNNMEGAAIDKRVLSASPKKSP